MGVASDIAQRLGQGSGLDFELEENSISVAPRSADGFTVWLKESDGGYIVGYSGWHEEFESAEEAMNCFSYGLSDQCRLKVSIRGRMECAWTLEALDEGGWSSVSTTALALVPFWRRKSIEYQRNREPDH